MNQALLLDINLELPKRWNCTSMDLLVPPHSHVTNASDTNTNQPFTVNTTIENSTLRASKLIELCQVKIDSLTDQD